MFIFLSFYLSIQSQAAAQTLGIRSESRQGAAVKRDDSGDVNGSSRNTVLGEGCYWVFSLLKAPNTAFTIENLLKDYIIMGL